MNQEFKQCLESNKIVSFARSDLADAKAGYENGRYKWSTIQGYYAMFHAARWWNCD
jgi:uncharacterized protein (UPF0332 family)